MIQIYVPFLCVLVWYVVVDGCHWVVDYIVAFLQPIGKQLNIDFSRSFQATQYTR